MTVHFNQEGDFLSAAKLYFNHYKSEIRDKKASRAEDAMSDVMFHNDLKPDRFQFCTARSSSWIIEYSCPADRVKKLIGQIEKLEIAIVIGTIS